MGGSGNESLCAFYEYHRYEQEKNQRTKTIQITAFIFIKNFPCFHSHEKLQVLKLSLHRDLRI